MVVDRSLIATVTFTDPERIRFFLEAYLILEEEEVTSIQFIDATGNGFGEDDLLKCFPSGKTYFIYPADEAQEILDGIEFTANIQTVSERQEPEAFEAFAPPKVENWILAGLLKVLNWQYRDLPMKLYFESSPDSTLTMEMWSFNRDSLYWRIPPPPPKTPETTYDLIHVLRSDTLTISDTTFYDQFYIYRTMSDTLMISDRELKERLGEQQIRYQPGLVLPGRKGGMR